MPEHAAHHAAQHAGHKAANGMQKKIGPLPLWAWIVIVGGTIGIVLYRRNKTTATTTTDPNIDPATGLTWAQEAQQAQQGGTTAGDTSGGGTGGGTTDPALADALGQIATQIGLQGTGGVTDASTPVQTFGGEITDVTGGIGALQQAFPGLFAQAPGSTSTKKPKLTAAGAIRAPSGPTKPAARKGFTIKGLGSGNWEYVPTKKAKNNGSGAAGHAGKPKTVSRTVNATHTPTKPSSHQPPRRRVVRGHKKPRRLGP